ncbi:MAG TPA: metallophosphoesterase [Nitrosopumilaceae archaeon]|nr:metallophosphoesterase [Nitrosopumilaceae archaeon]
MVKTRIVQSYPALILEDTKRYLVVTDLHIGFENTLAANDIFLEPTSIIHEMLEELRSIIKSERPDSLILLGDIKASINSISKIEWQAVPLFFKIANEIDTVLIPGNHDGGILRLLPENVRVTSPSGIVIEDTLLTHGHTLPSENLSHVNKIIMGHVHPVFFSEGSVLDGQRVWVSLKAEKRKIFPSSQDEIEIIIVPTFNKYFYASHKKYKKSISPIVDRIKDSYSAKIVTLDGSIIGNESLLESVI